MNNPSTSTKCERCGLDHHPNMPLVKFTVYAAFDGPVDPERLGDELADFLRGGGALTVSSEYEMKDGPCAFEETDELVDALDQAFPPLALTVGPVPGVKVLGRNGTHKHARLERKGDHIELWLGTAKERYPLVTFPMQEEK
jgi:hypothetical protein